MLDEIKRIQETAELLHDAASVEAALDTMAANITQVIGASDPILLCVINGGIVAAGKLLPRLNFPLHLDSIKASRYRKQTSGGSVEWLLKPEEAMPGKTVLVVDDILDEGITLQAVCDYCREQGASAVYSAVLVDKLLAKPKPIRADFVGLTTPDRYLFGYGMDYKGYLRNAAGIYACNFSGREGHKP